MPAPGSEYVDVQTILNAIEYCLTHLVEAREWIRDNGALEHKDELIELLNTLIDHNDQTKIDVMAVPYEHVATYIETGIWPE